MSEATQQPSRLAHWYKSYEQQTESVTLGMWLFLVTEVMFFGGLFMAYALYRWEVNIRAAAVLGFVGAGGLGQRIYVSLSLFLEKRLPGS